MKNKECTMCLRCRHREIGQFSVCYCSEYHRLVVKDKAERCPLFSEKWRKIGHLA